MDICDSLIKLRIFLNTYCDGFSLENANKDITLSVRMKILFLLNEKDMSPIEIINALGIAKSNLANISKSMIEDRVIDSYKNQDNSRNVYYRITDQGSAELKHYKESMLKLIDVDKDKYQELSLYIDKILDLLKGKEK